MEPRLYGAIRAKCRDLRCEPYAVEGTADHVHLLVRLHAPVAICRLVGEVKGFSCHVVNREILPGTFFRWQGGYGAFTVGIEDVPAVKNYIQDQKRHHASADLMTELEP